MTPPAAAPPALLMPPHRIDDGFLSEPERAALLAWTIDNEARFAPASLGGKTIDRRVRDALSLRDLGPSDTIVRARVAETVPGLIRDLRVTPFEISDIELELVAHNDGAHFGFHADTYTGEAGGQRGDRMLSLVYYFHRTPKAFSGGALRLYRFGARDGDDAFLDIAPTQNRMLAFPSWAPHEVRPVSVPSGAFGDSRMAVNCWVYRARPAPGVTPPAA